MGTIAGLQRLTMQELRVRYAELFGETTSAKNRTWLLRRVAWCLQALAEGDLSERARQRAAELASDADLRTTVPRVKTSPQGDLSGSTCQGGAELVKDADLPITVPRLKAPGPVATECSQATPPGCRPDPRLPMPGTILTRDYKGQTLQVEVLAEGKTLFVVTSGKRVRLQRTSGDSFVAEDEAWQEFSWVFGRGEAAKPGTKAPVTELTYGGKWYVNGAFKGPKTIAAPKRFSSFEGVYDSGTDGFRVVICKGKLVAGGTILEEIGDGLFRSTDEPNSPETFEFLHIVDGRCRMVLSSGQPYWRVDGL